MPLTSSVMRQSISNFRLYCCSKKIQMLRKKVKLLLEQLQVCNFAETVFGARCTLKCSVLRLLPPFAGALREKNRTRASFNKIPTNYISVESLINALYEKNTILVMFSFSICQEVVRHETTEGSSIEFIGYRIPQYEQNGCTVLFTRHQSTKVCRAFLIF